MGDAAYFVKKQSKGIAIGIAVALIVQYIPIAWIQKFSSVGLAASIGMTALTFFASYGSRIHGSIRWIKILGISFQPSELLKCTLLLSVASLLHRSATRKKQSSFFYLYLPIIAILMVVSIILLKQPDFGMTVTLVSTVLTVLFIANMPLSYLLISIALLIPAATTLIYIYPYRLKRVLTFLNPWQDPQGAGFQIIQSLIAIGSGGWFGKGIGNSQQKFFYLPMQHTDFIFSIIAEESGFIGCSILIMLYIVFLYCGIKIATLLKHPFHKFFVFGFVTLVSLQTIINISVATGLAPTKGIGLPFISYGNTGLICLLAMTGLIIAMVKEEMK
jgi:cell division protein FtsW